MPVHVPVVNVMSLPPGIEIAPVNVPEIVGLPVNEYALPLPINIDPFDGSAFRPVPPRVIGIDPVVFAIFK